MRVSGRTIAYGVGALAVLGIVFGMFYWMSTGQDAAPIEVPPVYLTYADKSHPFSFDYPDTYSVDTLTQEDEEAGIVFRVTRPSPQALFSVRVEDGLGMLQVTGKGILDALVDNVNRQYPSRFPDYQKTLFEEPIIANEKAAKFEFTYTGADGQTRVKQRFVIVVKDSTGYYLSAQAPEADFDGLDAEFTDMIGSFRFTQ